MPFPVNVKNFHLNKFICFSELQEHWKIIIFFSSYNRIARVVVRKKETGYRPSVLGFKLNETKS